MKNNIVVIALSLLLSLTLTACSKSPESVVESFYKAVAKGEITEAKGYLSKQILAMGGDAKIAAALSQQSEAIAACGGIKNIEVKLTGEGELRTGTTAINYKNEDAKCQQKPEKTKLMKEDGAWKITLAK